MPTNGVAVCADTASASRPMARPAGITFFAQRVILKWTFKADSKLELAAGPVVFIMRDWDAILKPQRTKMRNVQMQAESPVVIKISRKRVSSGANRTDIVKHGQAHPDAIFLFQYRETVFQRAEPEAVAANRLIRHPWILNVPVIRVTRRDVAKFETAQRVEAAKIIAVVKWHVAATQAVGDARAARGLEHIALEEAGEKPGALALDFVIG